MPTLNLKIIPVPPAIFLGDFADLNSFRRINPDAPPKEGLEASEGHIEGHEGRPSKRGASWSLCCIRSSHRNIRPTGQFLSLDVICVIDGNF